MYLPLEINQTIHGIKVWRMYLYWTRRGAIYTRRYYRDRRNYANSWSRAACPDHFDYNCR